MEKGGEVTLKDALEWKSIAFAAMEVMPLKEWIDGVIAFAGVCAAAGTILYARIAQKTLRSMQQVYVGVVNYTVNIDAFQNLYFAFRYGAMGANVPARQVIAEYGVFVDNTEWHLPRSPHEPHLLFPGAPAELQCTITPEEDAPAILRGNLVLEVVLNISYLDFYDKRHEYRARYRFEPALKSFARLSETLN